MTASFPLVVKTFSTKRNNIDIYDAAHMNAVQDEIIAIETKLGVSGTNNTSTYESKLSEIAPGDTAVPTTLSGSYMYKKTLVRPRIYPETQPNPPILGNLYTDPVTKRTYVGNGTSWIPMDSGAVPETYSPAISGTATIDLSKSNTHNIQMPAGNISIAITGGYVGQKFKISITQDSGGSRTVTSWFSTIRWAGGAAPTLTTTGNKRDTFVFEVTGTNTYDGFVVGLNI